MRNYSLSPTFFEQLQKFDLKNILHWERNSGLYFYPDFGFKDRTVEKCASDILYHQLNEVVKVTSKYIEKIGLSSNNSKIFCILAYRFKDHPKANEILDLLNRTDLTQILNFRSTDRKLYFRNPTTGLLTQNALPATTDELYSEILTAIKAKRSTPALEQKEEKPPLPPKSKITNFFHHPLLNTPNASNASLNVKEQKPKASLKPLTAHSPEKRNPRPTKFFSEQKVDESPIKNIKKREERLKKTNEEKTENTIELNVMQSKSKNS